MTPGRSRAEQTSHCKNNKRVPRSILLVVFDGIGVGILNIVICNHLKDESQYLLLQISRMFQEKGEDVMIFAFSTGEELGEYLAVSPDVPGAAVVSLDLPDVDPRAFARQLSERWGEMRLILTGLSPGNVEELFAIGTRYFLYTPFEEQRFARFGRRFTSMLQGDREKIFQVSTKRGIVHIPYSDILYVMSERRKLFIYQPRGVSDELYMKLDEMEQALDDRFVRCHQSYLVNMDCIHGITAEDFLLVDNIRIPISQKRYWPAKHQYINYVMRKG